MKKLGLVGISAIVFGSMIGSGLFNIAQNMACGSSVGAVIISWIITAIGMLFLVFAFKMLADRRPDLNAGIYQYAQAGFGNYVGFNIAWGYWLCTVMGNVAYAVMFNDSWGVFFPSLLNHGWESFLFGSVLFWVVFFLVTHGIRGASIINTVISAFKIASIVLVIGILAIYFKMGLFTSDFWGEISFGGDLPTQIKHTMLVTLWCFIGIEGAVSMSARAKRASDVGKAGVIGFFCAWTLYVLVSVLAFGVMSRQQMAGLENPSVAYLLRDVCGHWAYYFVISAIICSIGGGWIAWTLVCAQVPYEAAVIGIMPKQFLRLNRHDMPAYGLFISSVVMELFYLGVIMATSVYMAAIEAAGMMVLPAYLFCGLYLTKASVCKGNALRLPSDKSALPYALVGIGCTLYCLWLIYAGGVGKLLATTLFYLPGTFFFIMARRQHSPGRKLALPRSDKICFCLLCLCALTAAYLIANGYVVFGG